MWSFLVFSSGLFMSTWLLMLNTQVLPDSTQMRDDPEASSLYALHVIGAKILKSGKSFTTLNSTNTDDVGQWSYAWNDPNWQSTYFSTENCLLTQAKPNTTLPAGSKASRIAASVARQYQPANGTSQRLAIGFIPTATGNNSASATSNGRTKSITLPSGVSETPYIYECF